jgi:hypothetical protein
MGFLSKVFKGIKKVVKGVAKVIKKTVKGVAKVVKKVAKSKIFKAVLAAAAIYVTGGAALKGFGVTGGKLGAWAAKSGSGIFSSGLGKAIATPFRVLGTGLGKGARAITDFTGITEKGAQLGADSILSPTAATEAAAQSLPSGTYYDPVNKVYMNEATGKAVTGEWWKERAASAAASQGVGPVASAAATKGSGWRTWAAGVGTNLATNVATGYVMNELTEEDPTGQMSGLALEGKGQLDPFAVYYGDGKPLSVAEAYGQLLYGTGDPVYNQGNTTNLYTQDIAPAAA